MMATRTPFTIPVSWPNECCGVCVGKCLLAARDETDEVQWALFAAASAVRDALEQCRAHDFASGVLALGNALEAIHAAETIRSLTQRGDE